VASVSTTGRPELVDFGLVCQVTAVNSDIHGRIEDFESLFRMSIGNNKKACLDVLYFD